MPRITTFALDPEVVKTASTPLIEQIAQRLEIPQEYVVLLCNRDPVIRNGQFAAGDPFVEVSLFDRGPESEAWLAEAITEQLRKAGCPAVDVYFTHLHRSRYYENGKPF